MSATGGWGNEFELLAGSRKAGLDPSSDYTLVQQSFDMLALLTGEIDASQAMIYNEYVTGSRGDQPGNRCPVHGR